MNTARRSIENHWRSVGRRAAAMRIPIDRVTTTSKYANDLIREGYAQAKRTTQTAATVQK